MRLLVTGASGFVGTNAVAHFLCAGASVTAFLPASEDHEGLPATIEELVRFTGGGDLDVGRVMGRLRVRPGSFADTALLDDLVERHLRVLHAAGQVAGGNHRLHRDVNVGLVERLAASRTWTDEHRLVQVSSVAAQGPGESPEPVCEDREPRPMGLYGTTKRAGEQALLAAGLPARVAILRPCSILGPRDPNFLDVFRWAHRGRYLRVGAAEAWFQLVHVLDLVRVIERVFRRLDDDPPPPAIMHVAPPGIVPEDFRAALEATVGRPVSTFAFGTVFTRIYGWIGDVVELCGGRPQIGCSDKMKLLLHPYWLHSGELLEETLGGVEWTPLVEACRQTDRWYRENDWY